MDKETKIPKLSKDEAGKLRGGFSIESAKVETMLELSDAAYCTICFQQRSESVDGSCPIPSVYENATINIRKYFYDVIALKHQVTT